MVWPVVACAFACSAANRSNKLAKSPPATTCFDIFSPPPGDKDVISHFDRLRSIRKRTWRQDPRG